MDLAQISKDLQALHAKLDAIGTSLASTLTDLRAHAVRIGQAVGAHSTEGHTDLSAFYDVPSTVTTPSSPPPGGPIVLDPSGGFGAPTPPPDGSHLGLGSFAPPPAPTGPQESPGNAALNAALPKGGPVGPDLGLPTAKGAG